MRLLIEYRVKERRGGYAATAPQLRLTGHGATSEGALSDLQSGAAAWVLGLALYGGLDEALTARQIRVDESPSAVPELDFRVVS